MRLTARDIRRLFRLLDGELAAAGVLGELHVVGGAVMCLALGASGDLLRPSRMVRVASAEVAARAGVPDRWLNDAVKVFLGPRNEFGPFLELPHLRVYAASPRYLLAMKCAAMRLGEEFHDLDDVRYLLRHLDIGTVDEALAVVRLYFEDGDIPPKTRYALEEILGKG